MLDFLRQPWPWYVAGPLIGLMVPPAFPQKSHSLIMSGKKKPGIYSWLLVYYWEE